MMPARLLVLTLAVIACGPRGGSSRSVASPSDPCRIAPREAAAADSVVVGAPGRISAAFSIAPVTPGAVFAFAQVYETLVRVTCDGRIAPGLADRWTGDATGRQWTVTLRRDATFSDDARVTAQDVVNAWSLRRGIPYSVHLDGTTDFAPPRTPPVESVTIDSDTVLTIHFRDAHLDGPRLLADPYFAVNGRVDSGFPPGRGSGRYLEPDMSVHGDRVPSAANPAKLFPRTPALTPVIVLHDLASGDARDLIDRGVDVMVTADRRVVEYVPTRPDLRATPLPADRAYAMLSTVHGPATPPKSTIDEDPRLATIRASLARDVVRGASPSAGSHWWAASDAVRQCPDALPMTAPTRGSTASENRIRRLVYPASDPIAAEIAQRLVALSTQDRTASPEAAALHELFPELLGNAGGPLVTAGLRDSELAASLTRGSDLTYLVTLPRRTLDPCAAWRALAARAPWLMPGVPALVAETGPTLITSPRAPALVIDWDNTIRIAGGSPPPPDRR